MATMAEDSTERLLYCLDVLDEVETSLRKMKGLQSIPAKLKQVHEIMLLLIVCQASFGRVQRYSFELVSLRYGRMLLTYDDLRDY